MDKNNYKVEILEQDGGKFDLTYKIIIIGDSGVGKSCLAIRGIKNTFDALYKPTIGFEFMTSYAKIDKKIIKLQIWDTCGQEVYRSLIRSFYNNASLAIIVYSIDNENSFNNLGYWLNEIRSKANPDINIILIGNKSDLENERKITKEMGQDLCDSNGLNLFIETSAKTGFNVKQLFIEATKLLYEEHIKYENRYTTNSYSFEKEIYNNNNDINNKMRSLSIENDEESEKRKRGCC